MVAFDSGEGRHGRQNAAESKICGRGPRRLPADRCYAAPFEKAQR
jgi:hypothetical protein